MNQYVYGDDFAIDTGVNADGSPNGFRNIDGVLTDPTTVVLVLVLNDNIVPGSPGGPVQYIYNPSSGPITKTATGCYRFNGNTIGIFPTSLTDDVVAYLWAGQGVINVVMDPPIPMAWNQPAFPITW